MKRILSLLLTLTLVVTFFALGSAEVSADVTPNDCTTNRTVVLHYHRWDDDYTNMDFWAWGTGTDGSGNPQIAGTDDFGAVAYLCVADDADHNAGLIPRLNDWSYKDGVDMNEDGGGDDKSVPLRAPSDDDDNTTEDFVGFDENGIKHVYILQGQKDVYTVDPTMPYFQKEGFGTLVVIYYEVSESYDSWNIWNWGTGTDGTSAGDAFGGSGVPFQYDLGLDQQPVDGKFKVAVFNVASDADDTMGFIVRTDSWEKQWADDLFIDISGIKGSGTQFTFYIGGSDQFYSTFEEFDAVINLFEIDSTTALDPNSVEVIFNKDIVTVEDEVVVFDETAFSLTDKDGNAVTISQVSYNSTTDAVAQFTLITEEALMGSKAPYTVSYMKDAETTVTKELLVDDVAPVITILGPTESTLELGDSYSLPNYIASDAVEGGTVDIYNVRVKADHGLVDTTNAGVYEVVIEAFDKFGNEANATITVTVTDPCDETAHLNADGNNVGLISLLIALPVALGTAVTLKRKY